MFFMYKAMWQVSHGISVLFLKGQRMYGDGLFQALMLDHGSTALYRQESLYSKEIVYSKEFLLFKSKFVYSINSFEDQIQKKVCFNKQSFT